jgi:hypothetical protein
MVQQLSSEDAGGGLKVQPRRIGWGILPLLTVAGLVSSLETEISILRSQHNGGGNSTSTVLLGGLCLGLSIVTALGFYKRIQSRTSAALLISVIVVANCSPLFYQYVPRSLYQDKQLPLLGTTELDLFAFIFPSCLVAFIGFALVLLPARKVLRTVPVAIFSAGLATLTFAFIVDLQRGAWFSLWSTEPLGLLWQNTLAVFLGLSLWLGQIAIREDTPMPAPSHVRGAVPPLRNGWIALGILVGYFVGLHIWTASVLHRYAEMVEQNQARVKREIAQALADAPSRENLPPVQQSPLDEMLIMHGVAGWTPYASAAKMLSAENVVPNSEKRVPRPQRYSCGASYTGGDNSFGLRVKVTTYPTADWAKYDLRNEPVTNEIIEHPDWIKRLTKFGNNLYQEGPYFYWSSGNKLVFLDCQGIYQSVIDEFLKAYLEKYPSSV